MRRYRKSEEKAEFVMRVMSSHEPVASVCRRYSISESNYYCWKKIFVAAGTEALGNSIRRPKNKVIQNPQKATRHLRQAANPIQLLNDLRTLTAHMCKRSSKMNIAQKRSMVELIKNTSIPKTLALSAIGLSRSTYYSWQKSELLHCSTEENRQRSKYVRLSDQEPVKEAVFRIFHTPPSDFDFNRTTWKLDDLQHALKKNGTAIGKHAIRAVIKGAGYRWLKAKTVLTSQDPEYRTKLDNIKRILGNLSKTEAFFSIDEYGPFAVKCRGGRQLVAPGMIATIPQWQKSKGALIMTAALELSSNQVTHFYSEKKNTEEMIKLLNVLLEENRSLTRMYLSWDAASWHISKRLSEHVNSNNQMAQATGCTLVELAPLPAGAQFLNVIESVFSGMARAVIHNSNYKSKDHAKQAIDEYFRQRNKHFRDNPSRAGNRIWGKERQLAVFSEANNCKDPAYR